MTKKQIDKDLSLKIRMHNLLSGLKYECKLRYDDPKRTLKDEITKKDLLELDGAYYHTPSQCMIYLEATTLSDGLTQKVVSKHQKIINYREKIEKMLGVQGKVEKMILLFVSDKIPSGKDLDSLDESLRLVFLQTNDLRGYYEYLFSKIGEWLRFEFNVDVLKIEQKDNPIIVSAIKINMSGSTIYLFELPVEKILKTCYVVRKKDLLDDGYQRMIDDKKLKDIDTFLKCGKSSSIFPNSILVNLNGKVKENEDQGDNIVKLVYPMNCGLYHIIDGQHRVYGYCKTGLPLDQARLIIVGLKKSTPEDETRFFLKINRTQKKIDPTLLSLLLAKTSFSEDESEFWDSRASKFVLELEKEGIYKNKIYKGTYMETKRGQQKATLSYMAGRIEKTKLLAYRKKERKKGVVIIDGLLQTKEEIKDLSIPLKKINDSINRIINASNKDLDVLLFLSTNRGFDLICRLIKAYFKLKSIDNKFKLNIDDYFDKINLTKDLITKFGSYYGGAGMAKISKITERYLHKKESVLKKLKL